MEKAKVIFKSEEGKEIICDATYGDDDSLELHLDFGEKGSKDHEGLHVSLLNMFMKILKE